MFWGIRQFFNSPTTWLRDAVDRYPIRVPGMELEWSKASMMDLYDCKF
jgi:hypothetical protein